MTSKGFYGNEVEKYFVHIYVPFLIIKPAIYREKRHTGAIFTTNSPIYPKPTENPIVRWSFQRNRYAHIKRFIGRQRYRPTKSP